MAGNTAFSSANVTCSNSIKVVNIRYIGIPLRVTTFGRTDRPFGRRAAQQDQRAAAEQQPAYPRQHFADCRG